MSDQNQSITIKKYANRRLYNTATSTYVTLEDLSLMVKEGTKFNVYDAKSSEDITRSVLTQIIVEEENKTGQQNLLPISFLRQLISFYGDSLQWMVPKYLEHSMDMLSGNQDQIRNYFKNTIGSMFPFGTTLEEMGKQNMSMFENTVRMFSPLTNFNFGLADNSSSGTNSNNDTNTSSSKSSSCSSSSCCSTKNNTNTNNNTNTTTSTNTATDSNKSNTNTSTSPKSCSLPETKPQSSSNDSAPPQTASVTNLKPRTNDSNKNNNTATTTTPMPNVQTATSTNNNNGADDMQQKIANLQRQLADLAKSRA